MIHADEMATVWVLRAGERDQLVRTFLDDGVIGLTTATFGDGRAVDRTSALRTLGVGMDDEPTKQQEAEVASFLSFVRRIKIADVAVLIDPAPAGLTVGVVTGDYEYRDDLESSRARHRRAVDWRRRLPFASLPERLEHVPRQRSVLEDVPDGRLRALALECCRLERGDDPMDRPAAPARRQAAGRARAPRRPKAPPKPPAATISTKRCAGCMVTKPVDLFEDGGDYCRDCI